MAIKNINMADVFSSASSMPKQQVRLVCDYIEADKLKINPENEAIYGKLNVDDLIPEIVRSGGVKNPIEVIKKDGELLIISGHRRQLATIKAFEEGLLRTKKVPYFVNNDIKTEDDEKAAIIGRNTQREKDFKTRYNEIAVMTDILKKEKERNNEKGSLRSYIAKKLGISETDLQRYWDYNKLSPEIQNAVDDENSKLTFSKASELTGLNKEEQKIAYEEISKKDDVSTTEIRNLKKSIKEGYDVSDLKDDYSPKEEAVPVKKSTAKKKTDNSKTKKEQAKTATASNEIKKAEIEKIVENNENEDLEVVAIETCLSILEENKNKIDKLVEQVKNDDKGLRLLATVDYLEKLIANCNSDLTAKLKGKNHEKDGGEGGIQGENTL